MVRPQACSSVGAPPPSHRHCCHRIPHQTSPVMGAANHTARRDRRCRVPQRVARQTVPPTTIARHAIAARTLGMPARLCDEPRSCSLTCPTDLRTVAQLPDGATGPRVGFVLRRFRYGTHLILPASPRERSCGTCVAEELGGRSRRAGAPPPRWPDRPRPDAKEIRTPLSAPASCRTGCESLQVQIARSDRIPARTSASMRVGPHRGD